MTALAPILALIAKGHYADALVQLHALRRDGDASLIDALDLATGTVLLRRGEIDRAEPHLARYLANAQARGDRAAEAEALVELGEVFRQRGEIERAAAAFGVARENLESSTQPALAIMSTDELAARCLAGLAALACARGDTPHGIELARQALDAAPAASASARVFALLTLARCYRQADDLAVAEQACRDAIALANDRSLPRELAEAYLAYAHLVGDAGGALDSAALDPPAALLARAQELLREHGSLADLERVREAFQRFGRRATDRVAANQIRSVIEELRRARSTIDREAHKLVDAVHVANHAELASSASEAEHAIGASLHAMSIAEGRALTATQAMISERESIRTLLDLIRTLNQLDDHQRLLVESCRMAAQLTGADRGLVALRSGAGLDVRASIHMPAGASETGWRRALDRVLEVRGPFLVDSDTATAGRDDSRDELRLGSALVTPLRQGEHIFGAIYVDKELCGGVFTTQDLDLLTIFSAQVATMLQNARSSEELRLAARSRAATLEAISDGVLSLDRAGIVTSINAIAARILSIAPNAKPHLALFQDLSFLRGVLERGEEIDGRVTRIGAAEYVVNARIVRSDQRDVAGVVVTLTEMKRAKSIAQRIVGSHARYSFGDLIGQAPSLRGRLKLAEAAARSDSTVLITGESGTGKEVLAQAIHNASLRIAGPFVGINCSAIPRELLESELFGYEGGAFTGARRGGQPGKFELAEGGTILLDEIGDMPLEMQAKLLRVLQERRVRRIGGAREVALDARVIATTNRDLDEAAERGQFRADLLFRLKVIDIALPPLRERSSDIPVLVEHFLQLFAARLGKQVRGLAPAVMNAFQRYPWPGNIRELENVLESEINLIDAEQDTLDTIPDALRRAPLAIAAKNKTTSLTLEEAERELLVRALTKHAGSIPDVARSLGVSRGTVYNKLRQFAIDPNRFRS